MQKIFDTVDAFDQRCYEIYGLSEDILMEHAALGMAEYIKRHYDTMQSILIVCGSGNNGADGIALARLLHPIFDISLYLPFEIKSTMGKKQLQRSKALGVNIVTNIDEADIIVDALFGSGLNRGLDERSCLLIRNLNALKGVKLSCDIPSGILIDGTHSDEVFKADTTITMGALKWALFSDGSKDVVGRIKVVDLGVSRSIYEGETHMFLLDHDDLKLPHRMVQNTHKGSYGHCAVIAGEKEGAAILAGLAALEFGAGLVTLISPEKKIVPAVLMQDSHLPVNTSAICAGMGLGSFYDAMSLQSLLLDHTIPSVIDADLLVIPIIKEILLKDVVITPHPKEFCALLALLDLAQITIDTLQANRMHYAALFSRAFPKTVLLLKGANVIIAHNETYFINPHGSAKLSKGGSGDVLSGLIGALLAQGYEPLESAIWASLAHVFAAKKVEKNSYALSALDIISKVGQL